MRSANQAIVSVLPGATTRVRRATVTDLDALVDLEQRSFPIDRMSRAQYRRHLGSDSALILIASRRHVLVGSAVLFFRRRSHIARLYSLATAPQARGHGVGGALLDASIDACTQRPCVAMRLEVRTDNMSAIALYVRHGFRQIGEYAAYYEDGADALRYERTLP